VAGRGFVTASVSERVLPDKFILGVSEPTIAAEFAVGEVPAHLGLEVVGLWGRVPDLDLLAARGRRGRHRGAECGAGRGRGLRGEGWGARLGHPASRLRLLLLLLLHR